MDQLEKLLKEQSLRPLPPEWRAGILAEAAASVRKPETKERAWWLECVFPSPLAWAGVACSWVLILGLNVASQPSTQELSSVRPVEVGELAQMLAVRTLDFAEIEGGRPEAAEPKRSHPPLPNRGKPGASLQPRRPSNSKFAAV